jgi:hypothetical protein
LGSYNDCMEFKQCKAIVLFGRDENGNRAGLVPPRRCLRRATKGEYCGVHARKAELNDLLQACFISTWEWKVKDWHRTQQRRREQEQQQRERDLRAMRANSGEWPVPQHGRRLQAGEAFEVAQGLQDLAERCGFEDLATHIKRNELEWALAFFR